MSNIFIYLLILIVAITMTMVGKGGGNFYVVILALANISMYEAATTGQFILFSASIAAMIIFNKNKSIVWPLAILIGSLAAVSALGGGLFSHYFSVALLKLIFSVMLVLSGAVCMWSSNAGRSRNFCYTYSHNILYGFHRACYSGRF